MAWDEALDDGGLADAGLADQHRVVLGPAGQHLHDPLDLLLAPDHRVELALAGQLGEVAPELVEHQRALRLGLARGAAALALLAAGVAGQQLDDLLADTGEVGAQLDQHLGGHTLALADQPEQDVLGADVVVAELQRLTQRQLQDLLGSGGEGDVPGGRALALADDLLDLGPDGLQRDAERLQRLGGDPFALVDQPEQDVLGADVVVIEEPSLLLREHDDPSSPVGEALKHAKPPGIRRQRFLAANRLYTWPSDAPYGSCGTSRYALCLLRQRLGAGRCSRFRHRFIGARREDLTGAYISSGRSCGNSRASRIEDRSASSITRRSTPMPRPALGGRPSSSARR